jgi:hypothetical protein
MENRMSETEKPPPNDPPKEPDPPSGAETADPAEPRPHDLGREFSARAGRPGTAEERLGAENDAISSFTSADVTADHVAGRDLTVIYQAVSGAADAVRLAPISPAELDEVRSLFVPPTGFAELQDLLRTQRILFVRGDADRGKFTAAKRLLLDCRKVYRLHQETRLEALTADVLENGCGYVLVDLPSRIARELTAYDLASVATALEARNARLIVTVPTGRRFKDPEITAVLRDLGQVTEWETILQRRLDRRLGEAATDDIADDEPFQALVREEIHRDASPRHAALLADLAADAYEQKEPLADTVRARLEARGEAAFEAWADGLPDLPTQSMALAVAVLAGEAYETVSSAADLLQRRPEGEKPLPTTEVASSTGPFVARRNVRLRALRAHVVHDTVRTRHGGAPVGVVRFLDPSFQNKYLLYFWNEYDDARPTLLAWLRRCARHELESVRVRTAVATGILTAKSFDHVRALVIEPWARDKDPRLRDAAAVALRNACVREPALRAPIRNMVRSWSMDDSPNLQATAARSWRLEHDAAGADAALRFLEGLSATGYTKVITAICASVTEMWEVEGERLEAAATLLRWLKSPARKDTARLVFLLAAADLVRRVDGVTWPALLYLAAVDPRRHREIAALWQDAVTAPRLHQAAKEILAEWAHTANDEPLVRGSFARLMAAASDGRSALIIHREAEKWATGSGRAPTASAEVRGALRRGRR